MVVASAVTCVAAAVGFLVTWSLAPDRPATSAAPPVDTGPLPAPDFGGRPVEGYATTADHNCVTSNPRRPGVEGTRKMLRDAYPDSEAGAAWAPCGTHGRDSDHDTGRALDWHPGEPFAEPSPSAVADGDQVVNWLLATVDGTEHMRVRRLGITDIIWNNRIWTTSTRSWAQYLNCTGTSEDPTTCHRDHVHLSFGAEGADGHTSWWRR